MNTFDENAWWGDCTNSFHEEEKQLAAASRMGLRPDWQVAHPPQYDIGGVSVIDIGGGPVSVLLKCVNKGRAVVADPGRWPQWVLDRYTAAGIEYWRQPGEEISGYTFDEVWIYNTLQHVVDPEQVIARGFELAKTIRIFEWINIDPYPGHPHRLEQETLDKWLGSPGFVTKVNERGAVGTAYYGVFVRSDT